MQNQNSLPVGSQEDEIDLLELATVLWARKWLIVGITSIVILLAIVYLVITPKVYEAKVLISEAQAVNLAQLNVGKDQLGNYAQAVSPESAFQLFQNKLQSRSLAMTFLEKNVEPTYLKMGWVGSSNKLLNDVFLGAIKIVEPSKSGVYLTVTYQYTDPSLTTEWLNGYLRLVEQKTKQELINSALYNKNQAINEYEKEIASLRSVFSQRVKDTIVKLKEASTIAKKLNIQKPASSNLAEKVRSSQLDESLLYMRGYEVLDAEIESLEARELVDPFIAQIRPIQEKISYLNSFEFDESSLSVINVDAWATLPEDSVKPKKALVLVLAGSLGGMFGVFVVLILWMAGKRKAA